MADEELSGNTPIVVKAFTDRFMRAFAHLIGIEGGYVNDPVDRGGATKYGISLRFLVAEGKVDDDGDGFADFDLDMDGDIDGADIRKLTILDAKILYRTCFWDRLDCGSFEEPIGEMLFDQAVNGGLRAAAKLLQRALNEIAREARFRSTPLKVDGVIGEKTRQRLDSYVARFGVDRIIDAYREAVKDRYHAIVRANPSQARFLRGWLNRANRLGW
ncbi:MAG: hypothetical protein GW855_07820 [Erythrobacter sp.]|nr:hypothetical protein [Erythrobacter sp.]NCQ62445.1 hypothetical protein [Alphaproteobacteria bacterium]